jgi:hypothetical protein
MDCSFTRLDLLLSVPSEGLPPAPVSPNDESVTPLSRMLHRALLDSPQQVHCHVETELGRTLTLMFIGAGETAGVAYWMDGQRVEAISLLLSGLDLVEDLGALQVVMCAIPAALPQRIVDVILQTRRPLIASLYCRPELLRDLTISDGSAALAIAFFGMLGIGVESESASH